MIRHFIPRLFRPLPPPAVLCMVLVAGILPSYAEPGTGYILKPNDSIRLDVFNEPKLCVQETRISKSGDASFPLIGPVSIAGLSTGAAAEKIRRLYDADWLVDPKITLSVINYGVETVSVLGSVRTPGQLTIQPATGLDLATALATVGGLAETADPSRIELHRASGGLSVFSSTDINSGSAGKIKLASGDRVIVGQSRFVGKSVTIIGYVGKQGAIGFPISGKLDLVTAIASASGLTDLANPRKITVNRAGKVTVVDYDAVSKHGASPFMLQPGDIITVPQRTW